MYMYIIVSKAIVDLHDSRISVIYIIYIYILYIIVSKAIVDLHDSRIFVTYIIYYIYYSI
jgi:hypothetical protein